MCIYTGTPVLPRRQPYSLLNNTYSCMQCTPTRLAVRKSFHLAIVTVCRFVSCQMKYSRSLDYYDTGYSRLIFIFFYIFLKVRRYKKIKSNGSLEEVFMVLNCNVVIHVETVHISPEQREFKVLSGIGKNMSIP